jgi:YesN/AraC family two-component response regulator
VDAVLRMGEAEMECSKSRLSILVVDDYKSACDTIGLLIAAKFPSATIYKAGNGRIGLDLFTEYLPDIVITDINMPEMDGIEMATVIKSVKSDTHFIVITANSDEELLEKFNEIGCEDFIIKPIKFNRMFAAIGKCIAELAQGSVSLTGTRRELSHSKETCGIPLMQVA